MIAIIEDCLRTAGTSPSGANQQPWHFVVIRDRATLDTIPSIHPYSKMLREASVAFCVCGEIALEKYEGYWVQDCSAATENILCAATALGLGTCWLGVYPREERVEGLRKLLGLPKGVIPLALIALGHPDETKPPSDRYNPERVHHERW